jgi:hypothetical protein
MYVFITLNGPYKYVLHEKVISNFSEAKELLLAHWPAHDCKSSRTVFPKLNYQLDRVLIPLSHLISST